MDRIEIVDIKKPRVTGVSTISSVEISSSDVGDEILLLDEDGNVRMQFNGIKTYRVIDGKKILWDVERNEPVDGE